MAKPINRREFMRVGATAAAFPAVVPGLAGAAPRPAASRQTPLVMVLNASVIWNSYFDDRESVLNLEHGYIP